MTISSIITLVLIVGLVYWVCMENKREEVSTYDDFFGD